jgi:hypothetical protein
MDEDDNRSIIRALVTIADRKVIYYYPDIITNATHDLYVL